MEGKEALGDSISACWRYLTVEWNSGMNNFRGWEGGGGVEEEDKHIL